MAPDPNDNLIYHLDRDGKLVEKLRHTDGRANCLIGSTDVFEGIKKTDRFKSALARGAAEFCERYPAAWFLEGKQGTREEKMAKVALEFLEKSAIADFIAYCISDRLRHREVRGSTTRKPYDDSCPMSSERMLINGVILQEMLELKKKSESGKDKEGHLKAYRVAQFQLVVTILHEFGHMFVTYLGKGVDYTPPIQPDKTGEFGFHLEELVFGGQVKFYRDARVGKKDYGVGFVFMIKQAGGGASRWFLVKQKAIDSTLDKKFQLPFPDNWLIEQDPKELNRNLARFEKGSDADEETEDPGRHPEWFSQLKMIDPEQYEKLHKTDAVRIEKAKKLDQEMMERLEEKQKGKGKRPQGSK